MEKLVLIDGNSLFNRAFYATPVFTTRSGVPTNAVFGFTKLLFKIMEDVKPEYLIVAFDMKAPTFRHEMYGGYKATRKPMPEDLAVQVEPLKNLLKSMKVAIYQQAGIEADDILGTLSAKFNVHSYIYTGDRDSYQLVDEKTDVYFTKRGVSDLTRLNLENFAAETGLKEPTRVIDLKALMGDKSDNIPGIPGIGEKTAYDLLSRYGSLDGIYEHLDELKGATRVKFENNKDIAYLSYKLATINRNCNIDIKLEDCATPYVYGSEVKKIFGDLEFKSFLGLNIFGDEIDKSSKNINYPPKVVCRDFAEIASEFEKQNEFYVELSETSAEIYTGGKEYSFAVSEGLLSDSGISFNDFINVLGLVYGNAENKVTAYDFKFQLHILDNLGVERKCRFDDLSIAKYLCDYNSSVSTLKALCEYNMYDFDFSAFAVAELFAEYYKKLESENMLSLYKDLEKPIAEVLYSMESVGVKISLDGLNELSRNYQSIIEEYKSKIFKACGVQFNLNSPMQLGEVLYEKIGITEIKKKKTGKYTTGADVLEKLVDKYPVINDILKFRLYQKLNSTYVDGFRPLIDKNLNVIHTTFHQTATSTGRLSSSNPNLQNIPIRRNEGKELRKIFVPRAGNVFIDADYSQIELRLLAHFSGCKELINAYEEGVDIHAVTASQVFGVELKNVTGEMRRAAKAVNFGIIYGISDFGLSRDLNVSVATAKNYIEKYFENYSAVKEYMQSNVDFAKQHGYISTLAGRKRIIPEIKSSNFALRQFGERAAMNMPLQGSSADIIKIAMVNVFNALKNEGLQTKIILQVHDELVLESPENEVSRAAEILKYEMENAVKLKVPLTVDVHTGKNWYDAK